MNEAPAPSSPTDNSTMLFGFWYPALEGETVRPGQMRAVTLLETSLVVGRDSAGRAFALLDRCPHRAMPFSFGRVVDSTVECCYHGWTFDCQSGECRSIPALAEDASVKIDRILAKSYPCAERNGTI